MKPTDDQIIEAIQQGKSERLIMAELGTNTMRINRIKRRYNLQFETKITCRVKVDKVFKSSRCTTSHRALKGSNLANDFILEAF